MKRHPRRTFVQALGAGLVGAGLFGALRPTFAGPGGATAKRLVIFFSPNGTVHKHWRPQGSGSNFSFPAGSILEPLAAHQKDLIVLDGIDFAGVDNHEAGMAAMLTGGGGASTATGGKSLDQFVAAQLGQDDRFSSLELGVQTSAWGGNVQTRMSYSGPGAYVPPDDDPVSVYTRMFGPIGGTPAEMDVAKARRAAILQAVTGDLDALRKRAGSVEGKKLDEHEAALKKLQTGMSTGQSCTAPAAPMAGAIYDNDRFPTLGTSQMELLTLALACGMTRVASIQWAHTVAPTVMSWLGIGEGHHSLSHSDDGNTAGVASFVKAERWFAAQFGALIDLLKATPAPEGGTLFESTIVMWCKELGDSRLHDCKSVPFVLAGGGAFTPGRYLQLGGVPHNKLLVSVSRAMGLDLDTFGDPQKSQGPLDGL
ncbi:MAG: DUF1552 domain-containing protein [Minicystis sp.]